MRLGFAELGSKDKQARLLRQHFTVVHGPVYEKLSRSMRLPGEDGPYNGLVKKPAGRGQPEDLFGQRLHEINRPACVFVPLDLRKPCARNALPYHSLGALLAGSCLTNHIREPFHAEGNWISGTITSRPYGELLVVGRRPDSVACVESRMRPVGM